MRHVHEVSDSRHWLCSYVCQRPVAVPRRYELEGKAKGIDVWEEPW